ncbi:lymphocyte activation gene 3 protein [Emydura macquarii macquarii]|uniref:lymphocyte activation gene 3 protein n=1 Tax=Emydura macquarii macquarii TaxID=1129001 RepID=UPI00352B0093
MTLAFMPLSLALALLATNASSIPPGAAGQQRVWAKVGDLAVLPCHLSPQEMQSSRKQLYEKTAVRWERRKESSHKETHTVLEMEYSGLLKRARSMMPRASVRESGFRRGDFSLWIEPLLSADAGHYEALVRYGEETWRCQLELGVVTVTLNPPGLPVETEPFWLNCNSSHPATLVGTRWFHNDSLVPIAGRFRSHHGALSISRPTVSDSGPWRCELTYSDDEKVSATANLQILGFAGPASPFVYAVAGSAATLPCILNRDPSASGILGVSAHWSRLAGGDLEKRGVSRNGSAGRFTLHLPEVGPSDAGQYRCAVSVHGTTITRDVTLAVMTVTPSINGPVAEGSRLLLICSLSHPRGHERFQWRQLSSGHGNGSSSEATGRSPGVPSHNQGSTLELSRVSQEDTGTWECSVHGSEGRLGAVEYELYITGAQLSGPRPILDGKISFGLILVLLLLLLASILALVLRNRRIFSPAFPALERVVTAPTPGNEGKDEGQEGKSLQTEC